MISRNIIHKHLSRVNNSGPDSLRNREWRDLDLTLSKGLCTQHSWNILIRSHTPDAARSTPEPLSKTLGSVWCWMKLELKVTEDLMLRAEGGALIAVTIG